ncbi:hypothetical protein [Enterocloster bolteae]|uniref:hypothetical protein n=1 Tax=Enterocloster bolteae TaxID=208479 RepID=UPI00210BC37F|nr:hypothetical protein [Enterocloster bolteae]MCQ5144337.1 hypothetical protein [Enterocloster bolteae]
MTISEFGEKTREFLDKATSQIATWIAKKNIEYKEQVAVNQIQAQGALRNAQRMAMREMPVVTLNQVQANQLESQTFNGFGMYPGPIQLDSQQADSVMHHMLKQYSLDAESREELASMVASLVGIPTLMEPVYMAHELIAEKLILPYINKGITEEFKQTYSSTVNAPFYEGTNRYLRFKYNLHSAKLCSDFCSEYYKSLRYVAKVNNELKKAGVQIGHVEADGIFLEVYLKWTEV